MKVCLSGTGDSCHITVRTMTEAYGLPVPWNAAEVESGVETTISRIMDAAVQKEGFDKGRLEAFLGRAPKLASAIGEAFDAT